MSLGLRFPEHGQEPICMGKLQSFLVYCTVVVLFVLVLSLL